MLNKEQQAAADDLNGTSIIIAGAGTGKTQTLIHKLVNLTSAGVDPSRICLLTFTNDAADTMKRRATALGAKNIERLTACTYHSFCDKLMRRYNHLINQPNDYVILEPPMVNDIISIHLNDYKKELRNAGIKTPSAKTVASVFSACINHDKPLKEVVMNDERLQKACNGNDNLLNYLYQTLYVIRENVNEYKWQKKLKDFDDLLTGAYTLLDNKTVRDLVNTIYQYILIDEYQDTNHIQSQIVHQLRDTNSNLVVVGDDFQSIYRFRGAEVKNFTDFPNEFDDVHKHMLIQNYRSTQEILDLSNCVMEKHAKFGFKKTLVTGLNKHGQKPSVYLVKDANQEMSLAYALIRKYMTQDLKNGLDTNKIAVLYRGSNSVAYLEGILHKNEKQYEKHGGTAFFDMDCIQDVLSYLRVIANPFHELAWYRILKTYSHIGDKRAATMAAMSNEYGFLSNVPQRKGNTKTAKEINSDLLLLESVLETAKTYDTTYDMLKVIIEHYKQIYERRAENNESMADGQANAFENLDILLDMSNCDEYQNLMKWLDATALREIDKKKEDTHIVLSTIHSAKGLEWNHVILLDCVDGVFPRAKTEEDMNEELRCFYVAMTRAADTLDIICPKVINQFGSYMQTEMTPFLQNLNNNDCMSVINSNGAQRVAYESNKYADDYEKRGV